METTIYDPASDLLVVGVSQRSVGTALRERLFDIAPDVADLLQRLGEEGRHEALALATCERIEVAIMTRDAAADEPLLLELLAGKTGIDPLDLDEQSYRYRGVEALRHVFAVAASLDSQMVGEPQILGQVKDAHRRAVTAGVMGPALDSVMQAAFAAAKRVRSETKLGEQPVSIAASALMVARNVHGDLGRRSALLIGLGEMGEFMALDFKDHGVADLVVVHTSPARAESVSHRLGCHFRPWDELNEALAHADIVVSALGTGRYTITAEAAAAALKRRRHEPIFFVDTAVPRDIEPAVDELDDAFVYGLDDLERVAVEGKARRTAASPSAWDILDEEIGAYLRQRAERAAVPALAGLRRRFEAARSEILESEQLDAEEATRRLINRLLHDPSEVLRGAAGAAGSSGEGERAGLEAALRRLFRLDESDDARPNAAPDPGAQEKD